MRKLSKKISMLMVLAMLVGLFSGVVSASAASAWSFASGKYDVAVNGSINMESKEYADFDLLKDGAAPAGYTVAWASSDEDVVWVNAKTGQLRANKFGKAADGDKAVISATFTNTATKKSATRSFTIVLGAAKADFTVEAADVTIALGEEVKFAPVVKDAAGNVVKFATHKSYNGYFLDGKAIANPWTPEEAGEYTVTVAQFAKKADVADLAKAVRKDEVKVTVTVDADFDAKATGLKEITVYGDFAADAKFTVKKDAKQNVSFTATVAADGKSAKLALQNKLYEGVYTVAYGDAKVDLAIEDEKVASIIIFEKDSQIFTNEEKTEAYVHYDVLNQYGESVRKSFDVTWNTSAAGGVSADVNNGILTIYKNADGEKNTFNYNDPVVLTGVASGYGYAASETASMSIGLEDNASTVKVLGIVKKDSTEILSEIPASFVGGDYQIVFEMYNRAGYAMKFEAEIAEEDFTFTSLNPLLVKEVKAGKGNIKTVYINGVAYGAVDVEPAAKNQVKAGGVAEIRIVSTKTGVTSTYNLRVVSEQILADFKVIQPDTIIPVNNVYGGKSDVEIKFEATDTTGAAITDFRALYQAVSFSTESVTLREQNDGSAKLFYTVTNESPTKENDYPVVFTAIVPGSGKTDNVKFSVKYSRVASAPIQYNGAVEVLEGDSLTLYLRYDANKTWAFDGGIDWADQYDSKIETNGLFDNRLVGVRVLGLDGDENVDDIITFTSGARGIYDGPNKGLVLDDNAAGTAGDYTLFDPNFALTKFEKEEDDKEYDNTLAIYLNAGKTVTKDVKEFAVEFILYDPAKKEFVGGSDFVVTYKVVDLSQCVGFNVGVEDNYVGNNEKGANLTTKGILSNGNQVEIPDSIVGATLGNAVVSYETTISGYELVENKGSVWGHKLGEGDYFTVNFDLAEKDGNPNLFKDQSKKNADGTFVDRAVKVDVKATISVKAVSGAVLVDEFKDTATTSYEVANHGKYNTKIETNGYVDWWFAWTNGNTEATIQADSGKLTYADLIKCLNGVTNSYKDTAWGNNSGVVVTITNLRENTVSGLDTFGNVKIKLNGVKDMDKAVIIENAEIGDTFTVTYDNGGAKHVVKYTVGADRNAKFSDTGDELYFY